MKFTFKKNKIQEYWMYADNKNTGWGYMYMDYDECYYLYLDQFSYSRIGKRAKDMIKANIEYDLINQYFNQILLTSN